MSSVPRGRSQSVLRSGSSSARPNTSSVVGERRQESERQESKRRGSVGSAGASANASDVGGTSGSEPGSQVRGGASVNSESRAGGGGGESVVSDAAQRNRASDVGSSGGDGGGGGGGDEDDSDLQGGLAIVQIDFAGINRLWRAAAESKRPGALRQLAAALASVKTIAVEECERTGTIGGEPLSGSPGDAAEIGGDRLLFVMQNTDDATEFALRVQIRMHMWRVANPAWDLHVRIGSAQGNLVRVHTRPYSYFGEPVDAAAKMAALAPPDGFCFCFMPGMPFIEHAGMYQRIKDLSRFLAKRVFSWQPAVDVTSFAEQCNSPASTAERFAIVSPAALSPLLSPASACQILGEIPGESFRVTLSSFTQL